MNLKFRSLALLPVMSNLLAYRTLYPTIAQPPSLPTDISHLQKKTNLAPSSTTSPAPTFTPTIATLSPNLILIAVLSTASTPHTIPLDVQLRFFEHLWSIVDDINGSSIVPLVVLVRSGTASFGEIFAGILKDIGRAQIIGTTTHGNVEILWGYSFEDGSPLLQANETFQPINNPEQDWEQTGKVQVISVYVDFNEYSMEKAPTILAAIRYLPEQWELGKRELLPC
jgi:hypothetical protein